MTYEGKHRGTDAVVAENKIHDQGTYNSAQPWIAKPGVRRSIAVGNGGKQLDDDDGESNLADWTGTNRRARVALSFTTVILC